MSTLSTADPQVKPATGLIRGQAAKIARIHRVSITYVLQCAKTGKGRPTILSTIEEYRARNTAAQQPAPATT
jgi:hypothetical protein